MNVSTDEKQLEQCLKNVLKTHGFIDYKCEIQGISKNTDGFLGDIIFVRVLDKSKNKFSLELVLKCSKTSKELRAAIPVKDIFLNEKFVYETLIPTFQQFQIEKSSGNVFSAIPKFYGTFISEDIEIIILENLNNFNYKLWNKTIPMNTEHMKSVLMEYGKFHGISVAMKAQRPSFFQKLCNELFDLTIKKFVFDNVTKVIKTNLASFSEVFKAERNIWEKLKALDEDVVEFFKQIYFEPEPNAVFCHGDSWNNNFMFKYCKTNEINLKPENLAIIDWQLCRLMSPIIDVSYFLYGAASKEQLKTFNELIEVYYHSFSLNLRTLGSDPETLYSFKQFQADWKKYAKYGLIILPTVLKICCCENSENADISDKTENGLLLGDVFLCEARDKSAVVSERFRFVVEHFVEREFF